MSDIVIDPFIQQLTPTVEIGPVNNPDFLTKQESDALFFGQGPLATIPGFAGGTVNVDTTPPPPGNPGFGRSVLNTLGNTAVGLVEATASAFGARLTQELNRDRNGQERSRFEGATAGQPKASVFSLTSGSLLGVAVVVAGVVAAVFVVRELFR